METVLKLAVTYTMFPWSGLPFILSDPLSEAEHELAILTWRDKHDALLRFLNRPRTKLPKEVAIRPWVHLVLRPHPWRRQLYIKGRNMTARQLVGRVKANQWTAEVAADNLELPPEAIQEAVRYAEIFRPLLELESAFENVTISEE